jgi:glucan phosphorylase
MNEGHTALATLEIANNNNWDERKQRKFSFTTHTLVPAWPKYFLWYGKEYLETLSIGQSERIR